VEALASIRGLEAARVAGWGINHRSGFRGWVLLTGDEPASSAADAVAGAHSDVEIRTGTQHSYTELQAAQRKFSQEIFAVRLSADGSGAVGSTGKGTQTAPGVPGGSGETKGGGLDAGLADVVTFLETDMAGNAIRVGIDPGLAPVIGPLGTASELTFEQSKAVVAELLDDHIGVPFTIADGRGIAPAENFQGAEAVDGVDAKGIPILCTSGFTARRARSGSYEYGVITAGHCGDDGPTESATFSMHGVELPFISGWLSFTADAQFHQIPIPSSGSHYVADDYVCRDPRSYPNPSCDVVRIEARAKMQDDYVCHNGEGSGVSCGRVTNISYQPTSKELTCYNSSGAITACGNVFVRVDGQRLRGCGGDSGGPFYRGGTAYGITLPATNKTDCESGGKIVIFSAIQNVEALLGVEVLTEPVTLSAP
jgi:hypothetical protein